MRSFDWVSLWTPKLPPWEVGLRAAIIYGFIQLLLRLAGRKGLGRYSTQDIVMLFLIGTAARMSIVADDESLTSAFVGLATLFGMDRLLDFLVFRYRWVRQLIEGPPRLLVEDGQVVERELRRTRITRDELLTNLRGKGKEDLAEVERAYMEPDGNITFLFREKGKSG